MRGTRDAPGWHSETWAHNEHVRGEQRRMKILFSMAHSGALRNFASTIRQLADRGHDIHLAFLRRNKLGDSPLLQELTGDYETVTYTAPAKRPPARFWREPARRVRRWADALRYLEPEYRDAGKLRERAEQAAGLVARINRWPLVNTTTGRRLLRTMLLWVERAIPPDPSVDALLATHEPDVVLVTPLVELGSDQVDYITSARIMGIPTGLCVHSWDNLTNKGVIRIPPDRVYVWNDAQKREATTMHGVSADKVLVTGAPAYDQWFDMSASVTRSEFCDKVGLPSDRPFLVYLGSSGFIAPDEAVFVDGWLQRVRGADDARLRDMGVLVRPHPQNAQPWSELAGRHPRVVVWPTDPTDPVDAVSRHDFYDSIHYGAAVVGVNTSAMIEAGIIGRSVFTVHSEEHAGTQEGTLHFHYLLEAGGGLLHNARDMDEHLTHLSNALGAEAQDADKLQGFVEAFLRPRGLTKRATPVLADGIEELGRVPRPEPAGPAWYRYLLRGGLYPGAAALNLGSAFLRVLRSRDHRVRPLTLRGHLAKPATIALDVALQWRPARSFAKKYVVPRVVRGMSADQPAEETLAIPRVVDRLHRSDRPIIVGPWVSEVGFEILYWIPFLQWATRYRDFAPDRLIIVSRGGTAPWYQHLGGRYIDLFDHYTPSQLKRVNDERMADGQMKPRVMTGFDREAIKRVKTSMRRADAEVLHPMYMYRLFDPYFKMRTSVNLVERFTSFKRLPSMGVTDIGSKLPDDYVAVRFYFNNPFPETEENVRFVARLLARVTETTDVVLLNPGVQLDDHWDLTPEVTRRVHRIDHLLEPRNNLTVQTEVISRARAYVGNYGGLSYVAPFYGVPSLALYSCPEYVAPHHVDVMNRVSDTLERGSFMAIDVERFDLLGLVTAPPSSWSREEGADHAALSARRPST